MNLHIITIVLDGMPYIRRHLSAFESLPFPWEWHVREGAANNVNCTAWCKRQEPRLSNDGTTQYFENLKRTHPYVDYRSNRWWEQGKVQMFNDALENIDESCVLMEVDSDEIWAPEQLTKIVRLFESRPDIMHMRFFCRCFVGPDIVTTGKDCYGNNPGEWLRAWRFQPWMRFQRHEPPVLDGNNGSGLSREETKSLGLVFDHYSYTTRKQLEYKEQFYGYTDAVKHWERLQLHDKFPVRLKDFLPWVDDRAMAIRI